MFDKSILCSDEKFRYQLLGRMQSDCLYYLGYGNRNKRVLWAGDEKSQITGMKELWKSFPSNQKPEWLTWNEILKYEKEMSV